MSKQFTLGRESNRITIAGEFRIQDVRPVFALLHESINIRGYTDVVLDFSRSTACFSGSMLPLCSHVIGLRRSRIDFQLILPLEERLKSLFINTAWAHFICPRDYEYPEKNNYSKQYPATQYWNHDDQNRILNELLEKLLSVIPNFNRSAFAAVEWTLNEISDNVLNHASSPDGGLLQLSVFDIKKYRVEFTVADSGAGVPTTLKRAKPNINSDVDALLESVKSGVTRNDKDYQDNGLYGTLEICRAGGGRFSLNAGYAFLMANKQNVIANNEKIPFAGTTVDAIIDFSEPNLLERALAIDGKVHKPVDYIELAYEQNDLNTIKFSLEEKSFSFRSRFAGRPIRTLLSNIIKACPGQTILVDFGSVSVVSSSFADEVFGKLFVELGPMRFIQTIRLNNVTPTVQALIDRAITQRMQNPTNSSEKDQN